MREAHKSAAPPLLGWPSNRENGAVQKNKPQMSVGVKNSAGTYRVIRTNTHSLKFNLKINLK